MLTAKEALEITNSSEQEVLKVLSVFGSNILEHAKEGERQYTYYIGDISGRLPEASRSTTEVMKRLVALGYSVNYCFYGESYVPRGLSDDYGNGPSYRNYGIIVKW